MTETPPESAIDPRLRDYLDGELRRAEDDFGRLPAPAGRRTRAISPLAALVAVAVVLVAAIGGSALLTRPNPGPAAVQLGADGLPTSVDGQPVLRKDAIKTAAATGQSFLAAGQLVLSTPPCPFTGGSGASLPACSEGWRLTDPSAWAPAFDLMGTTEAPGFVRTAGALTVIRAHGSGEPSPSWLTCDDCGAKLSVEAIVWRQPTKGPIPNDATPPAGGPIYIALVPDFIPALARDGASTAGYIPKSSMFGGPTELPGSPSNPPQPEPEPVYGEDLTTLVGHMVAGVGFVPLGETPPPAIVASVVPASVAPSVGGSPSTAPGVPFVDCGRIVAAVCQQAIAIARAGHESEVAGATQVVVDDTCAPMVGCDQGNAFDSIVVFVTAGPDTAGWYAYEVTGPGDTPQKAAPWIDSIPTHVAQRLWALTHAGASSAPATPTPVPSLLTSPPPGRLAPISTASFSADGRTLTLSFTGGPEYSPANPCSIAYAGWAEAAGDTLYAAVVDVTDRVRPSDAPTAAACDAMGYGRRVSVTLRAPFSGARLVDLWGYVHFLKAPPGLVELTALPPGWTLRAANDVEDSPTGRWERVYSPDAQLPQGTSKGRLELYQAFGGPAQVSGGEDMRTVMVNGQSATLYRWAADGELVLVWSLGSDGLALVANETDFTVDALIRLAESARLP